MTSPSNNVTLFGAVIVRVVLVVVIVRPVPFPSITGVPVKAVV